jgi:16S rRNA (cytosine967-C5)-methyltransferase
VQDAGRAAAAIEILEDFETRRVPLKTAIADWARGARYAGAKDRAYISGLLLDVLRRRRSLAATMEDASARAAVLAALRFLWGHSSDAVAELAASDRHGPGALTDNEASRLERTALNAASDYPEWLASAFQRAFGEEAALESAELSVRADIDLRLNRLKADADRALRALAPVGASAHPLLIAGARIAAPESAMRAPAVTILPAFNQGWVEVQDGGSQIAALAAAPVDGAQVLDYCAGGGGKTLALSAMMANRGQLYAYDADARRLAPLYDRARRAGVRNLQIINPIGEGAALEALVGKVDVVFIDAPCTGSGTWRRHPDTKWRLTPEQLAARQREQDKTLDEARRYVKPGGRLVYVTCSVFKEENEDRLEQFLATNADFSQRPALAAVKASGGVTQAALDLLSRCVTPEGALRLTPLRTRTDGLFIAILERTPRG